MFHGLKTAKLEISTPMTNQTILGEEAHRRPDHAAAPDAVDGETVCWMISTSLVGQRPDSLRRRVADPVARGYLIASGAPARRISIKASTGQNRGRPVLLRFANWNQPHPADDAVTSSALHCAASAPSVGATFDRMPAGAGSVVTTDGRDVGRAGPPLQSATIPISLGVHMDSARQGEGSRR